jgi:hypothetical protein
MIPSHHCFLLKENKGFFSPKEIFPFETTWMNLEDTVVDKISQSQKDKDCMISVNLRQLCLPMLEE